MNIRFDNQVVIITGAERGIGFAHAKLLGSRGAKIVLNDIKGAEQAVEQLKSLGIEAIADSNDISVMKGAQAIVDKAIKTYGTVDVLINNAGVNNARYVDEESDDLFDFIMKVNVYGSRNMVKAVYPIMKAQNYGRIVNTTSSAGMYGIAHLHAYSCSKGAVYGMTRNLALSGEQYNIKVNAIAPAAATVMALKESGFVVDDPAIIKATEAAIPPEAISPIVAILASADCPTTGRVFETSAGRVNEIFVGTTVGFIDPTLSPEALLDNWKYIEDRTDYFNVVDGATSSSLFEQALAIQNKRK